MLKYVFALIGFFFCMFQVFFPETVSSLCGTSCRIFSDVKLFGYSFWQMGMIWFALAFFLHGRICAIWVGAGLVCDFILLCFMLGASPCPSCILIGFILFFCAFFTFKKKSFRIACLIWLVPALMNVGIIARSSLEPYAFKGSVDNPVIYWSPSCPSCLALLEKTDKAVFVPVAERKGDLAIIAKLSESHPETGKELAKIVKTLSLHDDPGFLQEWLWRIRLWPAKGHVFMANGGYLPLTETTGVTSLASPFDVTGACGPDDCD